MRTTAQHTRITSSPPATDRPLASAGQFSSTYMWDDLTIRTYTMPDDAALCVNPPIPALVLGVLLTGSMHLEERQPQRAWHRQRVQGGDLSLRPIAREPYELRWQSCSTEPISTLDLYLHQDLIARVIEEVAESDAARLTFVEQVGFQDPLLLQLGRTLAEECVQLTPLHALYTQTAAQMLAVHLLRHYTVQGAQVWEPTHGLTRRQVQRVRDYVQSHITDNLTLAMLAQQVNLSAYHFARLFRQATGESPHQFVLHQRIERAQWLLKTTNMPLLEVAVESGFANQSYLTTVFQRRLGITPRVYRRSVS